MVAGRWAGCASAAQLPPSRGPGARTHTPPVAHPNHRGKYTATASAPYQSMSEELLTLNSSHPVPSDAPLPVTVFGARRRLTFGISATCLTTAPDWPARLCLTVSSTTRSAQLGCRERPRVHPGGDPIDSNLFLRDLVLSLRGARQHRPRFAEIPGTLTIFARCMRAARCPRFLRSRGCRCTPV